MIQLYLKKKYTLVLLLLMNLWVVQSFAGVPSAAHSARMNLYDVKFYSLDLEIQKASNQISGSAMTRAICITQSLDTFSLELTSQLTVDSILITINNNTSIQAAFDHSGQELNVLLPTTLHANETIEVRVFYHGAPLISNLFNNGGFFSGSLGKFSACPPYNAHTWWPCKQNLTDLADSSWFSITTANTERAISNGLLHQVTDLGDNKKWEWRSSYPINFYLISFVVTSFDEITDYWHPIGRTDSLQLNYYGYTPAQAHNILQIYSDKFGLYPFYNEKLGFAKVNLSGGIENQTLIASNGGVDAHEIAHQWFGNHVGCASWKDVILSEGLSTWAESVYAEFSASTPQMANAARMSHFTDNITTAPVYGWELDTTSIMTVFGNPNLYYKKGAMVINSLRYHIQNDELFFQGIRQYLTQYGGKTAYAFQFRDVMEEVTGVELDDFFDQWYYKGGAPAFNIQWNSNGLFVALNITQTTNNPNNPLFKTPVDIKINRTQGDTLVRIMIDATFTEHQIFCPGNITGFQVDPFQWITNGFGTITHNTSIAVGVNSTQDLNAYSIYPNPSNGRLRIETPSSDRITITLHNLNGEICYREEEILPNQFIDLNHLPTGMYFVTIDDKRSIKHLKLLLN